MTRSRGKCPMVYLYRLNAPCTKGGACEKEDCMLMSDTTIKFEKKPWDKNEEMTPCIESDIVLDWIDAIGGTPLVEQVFNTFSKDLEAETLFDLRVRISDTLETLLAHAESTTIANRLVAKRASISFVGA